MLLQLCNKNALLCIQGVEMLHRDIYIVFGSRARRCIVILCCVGETPLRMMSLSTASSLQEPCLALPHSWKGSQVLVRVSTQ